MKFHILILILTRKANNKNGNLIEVEHSNIRTHCTYQPIAIEDKKKGK